MSDSKLNRYKSAILFTIGDTFLVKKKTNAWYHRIQNLENRNFTHPTFFIHPGVNHSPG